MQMAVIEFLLLEEECAANIHRWLVNIYEKAALYVNTIKRWVCRVNGNPRVKGITDVSDRSSCDRAAAAVNEDKVKEVDTFIKSDR